SAALTHLLDRQRGAATAGESSGTLLIRRKPATQSLERGSSVTHNSLVAIQRAHISLIDRRHTRPRRVPYRASIQLLCRNPRQELLAPLTEQSHINVPVQRRDASGASAATGGWAALDKCRWWISSTSSTLAAARIGSTQVNSTNGLNRTPAFAASVAL